MKDSLGGYIILGSCSLSSRILGQNFCGKVWDPVWFFPPWSFYLHVEDSLSLKPSAIINWLSNVCYPTCLPALSLPLQKEDWSSALGWRSSAIFLCLLLTPHFQLSFLSYEFPTPFLLSPFFWVIIPTCSSSLKNMIFSFILLNLQATAGFSPHFSITTKLIKRKMSNHYLNNETLLSIHSSDPFSSTLIFLPYMI